jgi:hypothetical protein
VIALGILVVTGGGVALCYMGGQGLSRSNQETDLAVNAALSAVDAVRSVPFAEVFARFNETDIDDLPGLSPGHLFAVPGLSPDPEDADGFCGSISFPGDGTRLAEDVDDRPLGMPRDLSGDGVVDAASHANDYVVLPVRVRVEWTGSTGPRSIEVVTVLARELLP